jgi:hypothetical protein
MGHAAVAGREVKEGGAAAQSVEQRSGTQGKRA